MKLIYPLKFKITSEQYTNASIYSMFTDSSTIQVEVFIEACKATVTCGCGEINKIGGKCPVKYVKGKALKPQQSP